ncbi:MAG: DUF4870 domain-containing protein [Limisphaerales bacterium]
MSEIVEAEVPSKDECVIAMLAHVLMIFSWFWAPLIIYFAKRDSRFVAFHALEALYWQIILICLWIVTFGGFIALTFSAAFVSAGVHAPGKMPPAAVVLFPLVWAGIMGGWVLNMVLGILFGIKASHGEWARYPVLGRWALRRAKARTA